LKSELEREKRREAKKDFSHSFEMMDKGEQMTGVVAGGSTRPLVHDKLLDIGAYWHVGSNARRPQSPTRKEQQ